MPSDLEVPTVQELRDAYEAAVTSRQREDAAYSDTRSGANYDVWSGIGAILFHRIATRDRDLFRTIYFDTATGAAFDEIVEKRWPDVVPRYQDTKGLGNANLSRPSAAGGAGELPKGTRIAAGAGGVDPLRYYTLVDDVPVGASSTTAHAAVQALATGPGSAIDVIKGQIPVLRIEDPLWDNTWEVESLQCAPGTDYEHETVARGRMRLERKTNRVGHVERITQAMRDAGAEVVALFASDYLGEANDYGLNRIYVGDAGYHTTESLLVGCRQLAPSVCNAGTAVQILPVTSVALGLALDVHLWDYTSTAGNAAAMDRAREAVLTYFAQLKNPFYWREAAIRGEIMRIITGCQGVDITPTVPEPTLATLFNTYPLPRYTVSPNDVAVTLSGPV